MTVGIPGWLIGENSFGISLPYLEFIRNNIPSPNIRILLPETPVIKNLELLILPGGADINPMRYGQMPMFTTSRPDPIKEWFDVYVLPRYIENNVPIFGICRGMQAIAVALKGSLLQDMYHETNSSDDPFEAVHEITIRETPSRKVKVNSRHHQSVLEYPEDNPFIQVLAVHKKTEHVEAIRIKDKPIVGVQWHPEDMYNEDGLKYTRELLNSIIKK